MDRQLSSGQRLYFGECWFDPVEAQVGRGERELKLTRQALRVLRYFLSRPGELVTKEDLLAAAWPQTMVSDTALSKRIQELRRALGDDPHTPHFLATVHGQGFRFIAPVGGSGASAAKANVRGVSRHVTPSSIPYFVGRETELQQLQSCLENALQGDRRLVFLEGEAGIGKTALVETLLGVVSRTADVWIAQGQCVAQYGEGEAYLPLLSAFEEWSVSEQQEALRRILRQHAPLWLSQMPSLLSADERAALATEVRAASPRRMLREMGAALVQLTAQRPLVLVLEDLQWSDHATLDLVNYLARHKEPACLLVLGTRRTGETPAGDSALLTMLQELLAHGLCRILPVERLSEADVTRYVSKRCGERSIDAGAIATRVYQRTEGNPFFMVNMVDDVVRRRALERAERRRDVTELPEKGEHALPENLRRFIELQIHRASEQEREILEAASVVGREFSAAAVAAAAQRDTVAIERVCEGLVTQRQFLHANGTSTWPDGTVAAQYRFSHALYQEVLYGTIPGATRAALHQRIGRRLQAAYTEHAAEPAAVLAFHFEHARMVPQAIQYYQRAGQQAMQLQAYREAVRNYERALALLQQLPDTPERMQQELMLQVALSVPISTMQGLASPAFERAFRRASALLHQIPDSPLLFVVLFGLFKLSTGRAEFVAASNAAERLQRIAAQSQDESLLISAAAGMTATLFHRGEFARVEEYAEQGLTHFVKKPQWAFTARYGEDHGIMCYAYGGLSLWMRGYPDRGLATLSQVFSVPACSDFPFNHAGCRAFCAVLHQLRGEPELVEQQAVEGWPIAEKYEISNWMSLLRVLTGWTTARKGNEETGIARIREGIQMAHNCGFSMWVPYLRMLLAETQLRAGRVSDGLSVIHETLEVLEHTDERCVEAELHRLKGELILLTLTPRHEAEVCFLKAVEIAQKQQARSLELRAIVSLVRLWREQGKGAEGRRLLAKAYNSFSEGFGTADLQQAKALLGELKRGGRK